MYIAMKSGFGYTTNGNFEISYVLILLFTIHFDKQD